MGNVVLSSGVRSNLLSLQNTADLKDQVQTRLATGKKVNTALDNPNSFFTSSALSNRATDLSSLLDAIGQGVQTLKAADQGITAITKLVESAKAKVNQALGTSDLKSRRAYTREYNQILQQVRDIARDTGYNGKNLLSGVGNDLKLVFNENNTSSLTIGSVDYTNTANLGLQDLNLENLNTQTFTLAGVTGSSTLLTGAGVTIDGSDLDLGDTVTIGTNQLPITANTTVGDYISFLNQNGMTAELTNNTTLTVTNNTLSAINVQDDSATVGTPATNFTVGASTQLAGLESNNSIETVQANITAALVKLRDQASTFGTNLQIVQNRQDFTKSFINVLKVGADQLVLADTNEEGANLLALNTRQQLSSTALSFASQADQAVLQFLR